MQRAPSLTALASAWLSPRVPQSAVLDPGRKGHVRLFNVF